jgi:hypothetical protein
MYIHPRGKELYRASGVETLDLIVAYLKLLAACWEARESQVPSRARGVPLRQFHADGVADHLLVWMLYQGHIEHLRPDHPGEGGPGGVVAGSLVFQNSSLFCLTEWGEAFVNDFLEQLLVHGSDRAVDAAWNQLILGELVPWYDKDNRVFSWGRHELKRFRQPAGNQELVLCAAEEVVWDRWFDDPLPRRPGTNPKQRLHDTIKDLNRRQLRPLIHFEGDGTGQRVGWGCR